MAHVAGRLALGAFAVLASAAAAIAAKPGPVVLSAQPPLAKAIAAFPRVVGGTGKAVAARINKALAGAEQDEGCGVKRDWKRTVAVTMRGPHYLSLVEVDDYYCGTAYPHAATVPLVFDLATGGRVDPKELSALFPAAVTPATLWTIYAKRAAVASGIKECAQVLADPPGTGLMLWPDAKADGLVMMATDLPHVVKACGPPITLAATELNTLGMQPAFLAALEEAHKSGWYGLPNK